MFKCFGYLLSVFGCLNVLDIYLVLGCLNVLDVYLQFWGV